jgi:hypothetical protein
MGSYKKTQHRVFIEKLIIRLIICQLQTIKRQLKTYKCVFLRALVLSKKQIAALCLKILHSSLYFFSL